MDRELFGFIQAKTHTTVLKSHCRNVYVRLARKGPKDERGRLGSKIFFIKIYQDITVFNQIENSIVLHDFWYRSRNLWIIIK